MKFQAKRVAIASVALLIFLLVGVPVTMGQTTRPVPAISRAVIISIDGCRPDLLLRADTPVVHGLLKDASFSFWARTTAESITLPSHVSMLTGVQPTKHQIQWNRDLPFEHPVYPVVPTLFQLAKKAGYTTAMASGKSKFISLAEPGSLDWQFIPPVTDPKSKEKTEDPEVAGHALEMIEDHQPQLLFVHFPSVDNVGHADGWATEKQLAAIAQADGCIGQILDALRKENLLDSTFVLITADHGGAGTSHGPEDPRSRSIPWIAVGPGIRKNLDLTTYANLTIDTEDTFATVCWLLGIKIPTEYDGKPYRIEGKPIKQIVERTELLETPEK